jgi:hypothetical protein
VSIAKENKQVRGRTKAIAAIGAVTVTTVLFAAAGPLSATPPTITAGTGSHVSCSIVGKGGFTSNGAKTALVNDWAQSDHQADPGFNSKTSTSGDLNVSSAVAAVPDTRLSPAGPITTTAKIKSLVCNGTATDGVHSAPITGATIVASAVSSGAAGSASPCATILLGGEVASSTITWKAHGAKVNPTTITGDDLTPLIDAHGIGFNLQSGTITGSFAGGTDSMNAYLDSVTGPTVLAGIIGPKVDSSNAATITSLNPCEPRLKVKIPKHPPFSASLKAGKGIKKIGIGAAAVNVAGPGDGTASTISITVP